MRDPQPTQAGLAVVCLLKGEPVRTTINESVDRQGGAYSKKDLEKVMENACKILADASAFLDEHIEHLKQMKAEETNKEQVDELKKLVQSLQTSWRQVLDLQAKTGWTPLGVPALDLEAARAEIESRLNRYAA